MTPDDWETLAREAAHALPPMDHASARAIEDTARLLRDTYDRGRVDGAAEPKRWKPGFPPPFVCPICQRGSWHPRDKEERFCGVCGFVDDVLAERGLRREPGRDEPGEAPDDTMERLRELQAAALKWPWDGGPPSNEPGEAGDG